MADFCLQPYNKYNIFTVHTEIHGHPYFSFVLSCVPVLFFLFMQIYYCIPLHSATYCTIDSMETTMQTYLNGSGRKVNEEFTLYTCVFKSQHNSKCWHTHVKAVCITFLYIQKPAINNFSSEW